MIPLIIIIICSAFILASSSLVIDIINERTSGFKLTQYNLGINNFSYWTSLYITNWVLCFLIDILFDFCFCVCFTNVCNTV